MPVSVNPAGGIFTLTPAANIQVEPTTAELTSLGQYLAGKLRPATGYAMQVLAATGAPARGDIHLTTLNVDPSLGEEGYVLTVTPDLVTLEAYRPAGIFRGLQTIRQLLPPSIESPTLQPGPWTMATGKIRDYPRFAWRGAMLDVARHFFSVEEVKRYIDQLAYYKINRFHMHLSDDQGWRVMINSWPRLATYGGGMEVGGGAGGYYTQAEYADLAAYAQSQYMILVPEIDMPGHTNAALAAYADLNCNGIAPKRYAGTEVGFSSLCIDKDLTYTFVEDVVRELAALTPGPYLHIGGDEASATPPADYRRFIERAQNIVQAHGKQTVGWDEIASSQLLPTSIVQIWHTDQAQMAIPPGAKVIISPAAKSYLDMKYSADTPLGQDWAGYIDVAEAYNWDPATQLRGLPEKDILGVEAPIWSETLQTPDDIEFMAFPRLPGCAEIGWSPAEGRNWEEYRRRLGTHGARLTAMSVNFYRSPAIPWS